MNRGDHAPLVHGGPHEEPESDAQITGLLEVRRVLGVQKNTTTTITGKQMRGHCLFIHELCRSYITFVSLLQRGY
jgi:hypothetical protein